MRHLRPVLFFVLFSALLPGIFAAEYWVNNPADCPSQDQGNFSGQNCAPEDICGDSSGIAQCFDTSTITAPTSNATSSSNADDGSFDGGYVLNCFATADSAAPFCDNSGSFWCDANSTLTNSPIYRQTICLGTDSAGGFGATSAGSCISGRFDCFGDTDCESTSSSACSQGGSNNAYNTGTCTTGLGGGSGTCICTGTAFACDGGIDDTDGCEFVGGASCGSSTGTYVEDQCISGSAANCTSSSNADCDNDDSDGNLLTCNGANGCEITSGGSCGSGTGTYASSQCVGSSGNCTSSGTNLDCDNDDSDSNELTCNGANGCEITVGGACSVGSLSGTYSSCSGGAGVCVVTQSDFRTGNETSYSSSDPLLWGSQYGSGYLINMSNGTELRFGVNKTGCIVFSDGTTQCTSGDNASADTSGLVPYSGATQNINLTDKNVTTTGTGFFTFLGGLVSRITTLFVVNIDASGNINASNYTLNGTTIDDWSDVDTDTQKTTFENQSYIYNDTTIIYFNETHLNRTIDLRENDTTYTAGEGVVISGTEINATLGTSISSSEIEAGAVNTTHILDGNVTDAKISSLNWTKLSGVPAGFSDNVDNNTLYFAGGVYVYNNGSDYFFLNETRLNATVRSLILLNRTNGVYIYVVNKSIILNETKLNETINAIGNHSAGDGITIVSKQINATLGTSISNAEVEANTVNTTQIIDGAVQAVDLANEAVTNPKIAADAVNTTQIIDGQVTNVDIAANAVNTTQIVDGTIIADDLSASSVNTTHIVDSTITDADISDTTNLTLGQRIVFALGGFIQNMVSGQVDVNGTLNVTGGLIVDSGTLFVNETNNRVGIGTSSPTTALEVSGNTTIVGNLNVTGTSYLGDVTLTSDNITVNNVLSKDGNITFYNNTGGESVRITQEGSVGIGTTSPSQTLTLAAGGFLQTPGNPTHVGNISDSVTTELNGASGIYISGKYAYVASLNDDGVEILDISDPANPTHVGAISDDGTTELNGAIGIYVSGKYAYVAARDDDGVEILDISDPTNPTHVGAITDDATTELDGANGIYVSGKYAYVAARDDDGVEILDISDPTNPTHVGAITDNATTALNGSRNIYVSGKYAYVTAFDDNGVEILDISDPTNPTHVGAITDNATTELLGAGDIYVSGKYAYVTAETDDGLEILDISNKSNPTHVGAITDDGTTELNGAIGVQVSGDYAYVSSVSAGVQILDISDPTNPTHVGAISDDTTTDLNGAFDVAISGKYAYIAAALDDGVAILDIGGIDAPSTSVGDVSASTIDVTENVDVGNNLYVRNGINVGPGGILSDGPIGFDNGTLSSGNGTVAVKGDLNVSEVVYGNGSGLTGIGAGSLNSGSINTTHILDGTISAADIAADSINTSHILDGNVTSAKIADNTITAADIAPDSINGTELADTLTLDANLNIGGGFNFSVNNSNLFVDVSSGRVGIGTTSPGQKLVVVGDLNVTGTSYLGDAIIDSDNITINDIFPKDGGIVTVEGDLNVTGDAIYSGDIERWNTGAALNRKYWDIAHFSNTINFRTINDGRSAAYSFITVAQESGSHVPAELQLTGKTVTLESSGDDNSAVIDSSLTLNSSGIIVSGNATVLGNLNVTGTSYLGDVTLTSDNITVNNVLSKDGNISFYNDSGSEKVRITQDGKVGIGTTDPGNSDLMVSGGISNGAGQGDSDVWVGESLSRNLVLAWKDAATDYAVVETFGGSGALALQTAGGNVGIGTASPAAKLDVLTGSTNNDMNIVFNETGTDQQKILFQEADLNYFGIFHNGSASNPNNKLTFQAADGNDGKLDVNALTILQSGNVGIGTTNPEKKVVIDVGNAAVDGLQIIGSDTPYFMIGNSTSSQNLVLGKVGEDGDYSNFATSGDGVVRASQGDLILTARNTNGNILFGTNNSDTEKMRIDTSGRVGIGTASPATTLDINGTLTVGNIGDNSHIIINAANNKSAIIGVQDDGDQGFYVQTNGSYRVSVNQNGRVGIGTTSATQKLDVEGSVRASDALELGDGSTLAFASQTQTFTWDSNSANYRSVSGSTSDNSNNRDIYFRPDGLKAYIVGLGSSSNEVNEYDLTTAWNISTITFNDRFDTGTQETSPRGIFFKPDGTKMYVLGASGDDVNEYMLSTPWDITTASFVGIGDLDSSEALPEGLFLSPDGTKVYHAGDTNNFVYQYTLSTAWDITSIGSASTFNVTSQDANPRSVYISPDGSNMYVSGQAGDSIFEYILTTPWSITTAVYETTLDVSSVTTDPESMFFSYNGDSMFVLSSGGTVYDYDMGLIVGGNVGIGTTDPSGPLHVVESSGSGNFYFDGEHFATLILRSDTDSDSSGADPSLRFFTDGGTFKGEIGIDDSDSDKLKLHNGGSAGFSGSDGITIETSGDVGIGATSPATALHVHDTGDTNIFRLEDDDGTCNYNPESGSVTVSCSSDEELKEDIHEAESVLDDFEKIQVRDYTIKASGDETTGVVAQEIQETNPDMVHSVEIIDKSTNETEELLFVEQPNPWRLLKGIQELDEKIDSLAGGNYSAKAKPTFNEDSVGVATVSVNETEVTIEFSEEYAANPIVTVTPVGLPTFFYGVDNISTKGFTILISEAQEKEFTFNWHAFAQDSAASEPKEEKESNKTISINESLLQNRTLEPALENLSEDLKIVPINDTLLNQTNETITPIEENVIINNLTYQSGTSFDADDDGVEMPGGVIDFSVDTTQFNWDVNESNVCTWWNVYSVDNEESAALCYGSEKCCQFLGMSSSKNSWKEPFYLTDEYGLNTIISTQVSYVDYSVDPENPYSTIHYSDWESASGTFYEEINSTEKETSGNQTGLSLISVAGNIISEIENLLNPAKGLDKSSLYS